MRVEPLVADVAQEPPADAADPGAFARALDGVGSVLQRAEQAEDAFAAGSGTLQDAMYERARADVALSVAAASMQRTAQALQSILSMQV